MLVNVNPWQKLRKVDCKGTSQICPNCGVNCGKKKLSQRVHHCKHCGYTTDRDVAAAQVIKLRGIMSTEGHSGIMLAEGNVFGGNIEISVLSSHTH